MASRVEEHDVTGNVRRRGVWAAAHAAALALGALGTSCTIETVGSRPATPATLPATAPAATSPPAQPSTGQEERTALHASVAAQVGTVRGIFAAVDQALRAPGLGAKAKRAHESAAQKLQQARQALNAGQHRLARSAADEADRLLAPAVRELSGEETLPHAVLELLVAQADESAESTARAMQALRATGTTTGLESYERAAGAFADAAAGGRAGDGRRALRGLETGAGHLGQGTIARWPNLRAP